MADFTKVIIIYNPNSTGDSKKIAQELKATLENEARDFVVTLSPTKYAGHAEVLARQAAKRFLNPLIISSSGDGGYNEVVNGAMQAGNKQAVLAVLPAGNANDHSRTMQSAPLGELIKRGRVSRIDLLKFEVAQSDGTKTARYAHSYIGLGLTPVIATELNRHSLNALREIKIVLQRFYRYRPFKIKRGNKVITLNSLLFGNINQMAKVLTIAKENKPADGKFEVVIFQAAKKRKLLASLFRAAVRGLETKHRESEYVFETIKKMPVQLDGETMTLMPGSKVIVSSAKQVLRTLV